METIHKELVIKNEDGLHARPAAKFVRLAIQFPCDILVESNGEQVNGKSILGLMILGTRKGSILKLTITGEEKDAIKFLLAIEELLDDIYR